MTLCGHSLDYAIHQRGRRKQVLAVPSSNENLARIPQIDHNFADLQRRFGYKNQQIAAILGARSWRTRWVKRNLSLFGSISIVLFATLPVTASGHPGNLGLFASMSCARAVISRSRVSAARPAKTTEKQGDSGGRRQRTGRKEWDNTTRKSLISGTSTSAVCRISVAVSSRSSLWRHTSTCKKSPAESSGWKAA